MRQWYATVRREADYEEVNGTTARLIAEMKTEGDARQQTDKIVLTPLESGPGVNL